MKTIILAAGFGSRLWPLSTSERPKQFQKFINDTSLLQHSYSLMNKVSEIEEIYVLTLKGLEQLVFEQLPAIDPKNVIIVPERRNTLPHTAYALNVLAISDSEPVMFVPVDHYFSTPEVFVDSLRSILSEIPSKINATYLLCTPTNTIDPSLGYVILDANNNVSSFVEKPDNVAAVALQESAIFKNTSRYITSKQAFINLLEAVNDDITMKAKVVIQSSADQLNTNFLAMPLIDLSSGLFEKSKDLKGLLLAGDFIDIGKFGTLYELNSKDVNRNAIIGPVLLDEKCSDNFVINQLDSPLVVINTQNSVIVQTTSGSFVSPMKDADKIGEIYKTRIDIQ